MAEKDFQDYVSKTRGDMSHYGYNELFDTRQANRDLLDFGYLLDVAKKCRHLKTHRLQFKTCLGSYGRQTKTAN